MLYYSYAWASFLLIALALVQQAIYLRENIHVIQKTKGASKAINELSVTYREG
jgi:hypothetical protein